MIVYQFVSDESYTTAKYNAYICEREGVEFVPIKGGKTLSVVDIKENNIVEDGDLPSEFQDALFLNYYTVLKSVPSIPPNVDAAFGIVKGSNVLIGDDIWYVRDSSNRPKVRSIKQLINKNRDSSIYRIDRNCIEE